MILVDGRPWLAGGRIDPESEGVRYGRGLFETIRWQQGRAPLLDWHIERLAGSAAALGIGWPPALERELESWIALAASDLSAEGEVALRLTLLATGRSSPPTVILSARAYTPPEPSVRLDGVELALADERIFSGDRLRRHKSCNYLFNRLARERARAGGAYDAVLLDERGRVWETTSANLYFVREGRVWTPLAGGPMLPGVMRRFLLERVLPEAGFEVCQTEIDSADLETAEGAFLTNALIGVLAVARIGAARLTVSEEIRAIAALSRRRLAPRPGPGEG